MLYYLVEALDCPTVNNKQNPRQTIYSTPQTGIYITLTWAFLAHYPSVEIVQISVEDNFAKRPITNMSAGEGHSLTMQK